MKIHGNKGKKRSLETRMKMSKVQSGHKTSKEARLKMSLAKLGKKRIGYNVEKWKESRKGYKHSEETKIKIGLGNLGKFVPSGKDNYCYGTHPSKESRVKMSESHKGEKNGKAWKGGINPINDTIRKSLEIKEWRAKCLKKGNYICKKCDVTRNLQVHHIKNFADYPLFRFKVSNGAILCKICHFSFHKIYGKKNNTRKQLLEFISLL